MKKNIQYLLWLNRNTKTHCDIGEGLMKMIHNYVCMAFQFYLCGYKIIKYILIESVDNTKIKC